VYAYCMQYGIACAATSFGRTLAVDATLIDLCPQLMRVDGREPVLLPLQW
jgi:hypothetical protein